MMDKIKQLAKEYAPEFIQVRHHLHAHPELSYQEFETSKFIQNKLEELGIPLEIKATTGIVGLLKGKNPESRVFAIRADMDALPITEENDVPYKSKNKGVMHACGHDVHTTCLLGAAKILNELRNEWEGTIKLIFQPGEEKNPGGASYMIKEGVLENPKPSGIMAMHVHTGMPVGKASFRSGKVMASADEIYITIKGRGGHAASPHLCVDPILIASQLVLSLQQVVSRNADPFEPSVLSITSIQGGATTNVIPNEVKLMGTFRAMNEKWRSEAHLLIRKIAEETVRSMGADVELHIDKGYPAVINNRKLNEAARHAAEEFLGKENVEETELRMGAEDFGYYAQQVPACFYRVGVRNEQKGITSGVHTPDFDIDENAIEVGIGLMAWLGCTLRF
jgi:hippurate hydrolase